MCLQTLVQATLTTVSRPRLELNQRFVKDTLTAAQLIKVNTQVPITRNSKSILPAQQYRINRPMQTTTHAGSSYIQQLHISIG
jgi:hypothetical protein